MKNDNGSPQSEAPIPPPELTVPVASVPRKFLIFSILSIVLLGIGVYANSLDGAFVWDDQHLIRENPLIKQGNNALKLFQGNILAGYGKESQAYRPLQMLTYMADYRLWKLDPRGYHVTSIFWHILAALCVFGLAFRLSANRLLALFAGLLFVSHPIHTEAVSYISGRSDPLPRPCRCHDGGGRGRLCGRAPLAGGKPGLAGPPFGLPSDLQGEDR